MYSMVLLKNFNPAAVTQGLSCSYSVQVSLSHSERQLHKMSVIPTHLSPTEKKCVL
jgi:hypothetical protein